MMEPLAQKICNLDTIARIHIADQEHKITLFAADIIILTLTELASSLPKVYKVLNTVC